jgi:hypothetical protein
MLLNHYEDKWDLRIGRQRNNWGIHDIWNINDIFYTYNFWNFDYQHRLGINDIRLQRNLKDNSTLGLAFAPRKRRKEHTAAVLFCFKRKKYDLQLLGGVLKSDFVVVG